MKRELLAAVLMALLILGAVWNIRKVDSLTSDIFDSIERTEAAVSRGDTGGAKAELEKGLGLWLDADSYTHIFIRHSEIDSTTDSFYEALEEISDNDSEATSAALEKLKYHMDSLNRMEHISLGSIM